MQEFSFFKEQFYSENPVLSAKKLVAWKRENRLYNFKRIPKTAIVSVVKCFSGKNLFFKKEFKGLQAKVHQINNVVLVTDFGIGAPAIIALLEELKELGVKQFVFIGFAGRLTDTINSDEIFNVNEAFSINGTSYFYTNNKQISYKNDFQIAISKILQLENKNVVSTDAPFRETISLLLHFKNKNTSLIDMETASILAFGKYYNIAVSVLLIASDLLLPEWKPPKNKTEIRKKINQIILKLSKEF